MSFTAADVMRRASIILQDTDAVRWTAIEMRDWLNEAQRTVVSIKPNALSRTAVLALDSGTRQTLPPEYAMLSKVVCNVGPLGVRGRAVRTLARREILDAQIPDWHNPGKLPHSQVVTMAFQDYMAAREFYVVPGNDGTGKLECIVTLHPTNIPEPAGNPLDIDSYLAVSQFDDRYQSILLDFLLARAFSKDSAAPDAAQRSQVHLGLATAALTALTQSETTSGLAYQYAPPVG